MNRLRVLMAVILAGCSAAPPTATASAELEATKKLLAEVRQELVATKQQMTELQGQVGRLSTSLAESERRRGAAEGALAAAKTAQVAPVPEPAQPSDRDRLADLPLTPTEKSLAERLLKELDNDDVTTLPEEIAFIKDGPARSVLAAPYCMLRWARMEKQIPDLSNLATHFEWPKARRAEVCFMNETQLAMLLADAREIMKGPPFSDLDIARWRQNRLLVDGLKNSLKN